MSWSRSRRAFAGTGLALVTTMVVPVAAAASNAAASRPDGVLKTFLEDIGAHKISAPKSLMTPNYERYIARTADSVFTNVITLTNIMVGRVHYYGVRQANVPCTFLINQYHVGGWNNGRVTFAFQLTETRPGSPWKVSSRGTG